MKLTVLLESGAKTISATPGQTLLDAIRAEEGLPVHAPCGGQGTCQKCTVYLTGPEGETAVLACRTSAEDGMVVRLPAAAPLSVQLSADEEDTLPIQPDEGLTGYGVACDIGTTT